MTDNPPPSASASAYACPSCGAAVWPGDNFCESCRAELSPAVFSGASPDVPARCPTCPGAGVTPEGYCESCGRKVPAGSDHFEKELDLLAGVTDRGVRHPRNEDAMALATARTPDGQPVALAVICDGVSTSSRPDEASHQAARAAMQVLLTGVRASAEPASASADAFTAAQEALIAMAAESAMGGNAPSATFISAIVTGRDATICWLGDTRAYWLEARDTAESRLLSRDDSVAQELINRGLSESAAMASPASHVVTGWIGADLPDAKPHVITFVPDGQGAVLLCSDGLWNYQPDAVELAKMALPAALTSPRAVGASLVDFAIAAGGSDNITVVIVPFPVTDPAVADPAVAASDQAAAAEPDTVEALIPEPETIHMIIPEPIRAQTPESDPETVEALIPEPEPETAAAQIPQTKENPAHEPG